jgi:hypothetical protein
MRGRFTLVNPPVSGGGVNSSFVGSIPTLGVGEKFASARKEEPATSYGRLFPRIAFAMVSGSSVLGLLLCCMGRTGRAGGTRG